MKTDEQEPANKTFGNIAIDKAAKQHQLVVEGTQVYFPHGPYSIQLDYMGTVIRNLNKRQNSLLQSPTGTGKTLSLLCSVFAWLKKHREEHPNEKQPIRVIYTSRTHSQLKQVVRELKKTVYRPVMSTAASRDNSCCNTELNNLTGSHKEMECRMRVAQINNKYCKYSRLEHTYSELLPNVAKNIMDLEELVAYGKQKFMCPFYYSRAVRDKVDLLLIPYNYILDQNIKRLYTINCKNAIIIFDQAHNLPSSSEDCNSFELSVHSLDTAIEQLSHLRQSILRMGQANSKIKLKRDEVQEKSLYSTTVRDIQAFSEPLDKFRNDLIVKVHKMFNSQTEMEEGIVYDFDRFIKQVAEGIRPIWQDFQKFEKTAKTIMSDLMYHPNWAVDLWITFVVQVQSILSLSQKHPEPYKAIFKVLGSNLSLNIICLDPSISFKKLQEQQPYCIMLTSGTLAPMELWKEELGIDFAQPLCCRHLITNQQLFGAVLGEGFSRVPLNFSFKERDKIQMYQELLKVLERLFENIPNGVLVLFATYGLLQLFRHQTFMQRSLHRFKELEFEQQNTADFKVHIENYLKNSKKGRGAALFAVMRGKVAEGIDLSNEQCRAVIVVGVPFPNLKDKKIEAKKRYLDNKKAKLNGRDWYLAETFRAINQGIGRVIRNIDDYGCILLIDSRFHQEAMRNNISEWARSQIEDYHDACRLAEDVRKFFKKKTLLQIQQHEPEIQEGVANKLMEQKQQKQQQKSIEAKRQFIFPKKKLVNISYLNVQGVEQERRVAIPPMEPIQPRKHCKSEGAVLNKAAVKHPNQQLKGLLQEYKKEQALKKPIITRPQVTPRPPIQDFNRSQPTQAQKSDYRSTNFEHHHNELKECPICQSQKILIKNKACSHAVCRECWDMWLQQYLNCPMCRERVRKPYLYL